MGGHLGRVGNYQPIFGQLSDAAAVAEAQSIKGQLISKCLLGVIFSTKKPTKFL